MIKKITTRILIKYPSKQIVETAQDRDKFGKLEQIKILELEELYGRVLGLALCDSTKR